MAKRLTDTNKWRMAWFRKLGSEGRDIFNYLYDNCDFAGVFELDCERMAFDLGFDVTMDRIKSVLRGKMTVISDDRLFLPAFVEFQYGELSEESRPHVAVIKRLKTQRVWKEYLRGMHTTKDKDKEKDNSSLSSFLEEVQEKPFKPDFAGIYKLYPRKEGKARGLAILKGTIKTLADQEACFKSLAAFIAHHKRKGTEADFFPHFKTWAGSWRDCLDPDYGESESFASSDPTGAEAKERALFEEPA